MRNGRGFAYFRRVTLAGQLWALEFIQAWRQRQRWNRFQPSRMKQRREEDLWATCTSRCRSCGKCFFPEDCRNT